MRALETLLAVATLGITSSVAHADITIYAAGDIAYCPGDASRSAALRTAALVPATAPVLVLGDTVYPSATPAQFQRCYQPTWGRLLPNTLAVPGNHDYVNGSKQAFIDYFGKSTDSRGYLERQLGSWLVIGLDSNVSGAAMDTQLQWLERTLKERAEGTACILAFWHHALHSNGLHRGDGAQMRPAWELLERFGADIVLSGHEHFYEAFEPLSADGRFSAQGIREFVVGTGGAPLRAYWRPFAHSRKRLNDHGVLELTLQASGYQWQFITVDGETNDRGSDLCHAKTHSPQ